MTPLNISRSRYLSAILLLIGTAGVLSVVCLPIFWGAQALMSLGLVAYTWHAIQRYALLQHSESWLGLRQDSQQQIVAWRGRTADQIKQYPIRLHPDSVVCHFFILLRFQIAGEQRWHSLLVMPDACQAEVMREWVVGLTWGLAGSLRQAELAQQTTPPSA